MRTRVSQSVVVDFDPGALNAEHFADQRRKRSHRASKLPAEDLNELLGLLVGRPVVYEHSEPPIAIRHHLRCVRNRCDRQAADVSPFDLALADLEDQGHPTEVVRGAVIE